MPGGSTPRWLGGSDRQVRAILDLDLPPLAQWRDQRLVDDRHPAAFRSFDLHGVADVHDAGLDPAQLGAVGVLQVERVPEPERFAVDAVDPLALGVLDPVVVSYGEDLLPHLVLGGGAATAEYLSFLTAFLPPAS